MDIFRHRSSHFPDGTRSMIVLELATDIRAPIERVFDLERCIDLHVESAGPSREQAIGGVTHGLIGPGEEVTWRGKHFGVWLKHTSRITAFDRPRHFRDEMMRGLFRSFSHDHSFEALPDGRTRMRDRMAFEAPFRPLGWLVERLLLGPHLRGFLEERNRMVRTIAEGDGWRRFLDPKA